NDVDAVKELRTQPAFVADALRPTDHHRIARSAEVRRHLFGPLERSIRGNRPADRDIWLGLRAANVVVLGQQAGQAELDAVQTRNAVDRALQTAFGRGAIVADDVNDQRIVELTFRSNGVDHASDLGVGIFEVGRVVLHHPRIDSLRVLREAFPCGYFLRKRRGRWVRAGGAHAV